MDQMNIHISVKVSVPMVSIPRTVMIRRTLFRLRVNSKRNEVVCCTEAPTKVINTMSRLGSPRLEWV